MKHLGCVVALLTVLPLSLLPAYGADPRYPDWPCVQPKVPELSAAAMWDGPSIAEVGNAWQDDPGIKDLVARLAARRTPLDIARKAISDFMADGDAAAKQDKAKKLFAGLFETLSAQRSEVMNGIERVSRNEADLADKIRTDVANLRQLEDKPDADQSEVTTLASQVEWSTRIFEDRRKAIRYVCEVPTTIEQRVFALARAIRQNLD